VNNLKYKKRIIQSLIVALWAAAITCYIKTGNPLLKSQPPEYVFSYGENQPENYPTTMGAYYFARLVEEQTEGRIKILVKSNGELGQEANVIWQMQHGGVDFARVSLSQLSAMDASFNVLQLPYLYVNSDHMWKVLEGTIGDDFLNLVNEYELVGLSWYDAGARNFYNNVKPITCLEDMEGMRIRVQQADMMVDMIETLGAKAVPMSYEEVYSNLQQKKVDGAENNWPSYESMNHYEVAKYYTIDEHTRIPEMQLCSKHTWDKLTPEDQNIISLCAWESALYERELWKEREKESKNKVLEKGTIVTELSPEEKEHFRNAMEDIYEKYCGENMDIVEQIIQMGTE